ncbi:CNNM domain-containing protein [uncultured Helicobacter sp.]|uniref:CNNM domain-containing protein n=1 Tax=uncultured Helicobacter sp. TaxID=175537 RepID=UPI00260F3477|nr:CNNM domain-containing protein [uncultured Helicobacter sp.]
MFLLVIYCLIAIVFTFFCSIMESVFLSITPSFVASFEKQNPKIGSHLKRLKDNVDDAEGAILVLNTFATTAAATGVGIQVAKLYGLNYQALGATILTIVLIYLSEILPKTIGATYWKNLAPYVTLSIHYLLKIVFPFVLIAKLITRFVKTSSSLFIGRDEILAASQIGHQSGSISMREEYIIENLLKLKNYQAIDILTPRSVVVSLCYSDTLQKALKQKEIHNYSRIPVYGESVDSVIGIVHTQDILEAGLKEGLQEKQTIGDFVRPVYIVPFSLSVLNLLNLFIAQKEQLFVVQDRYGQFYGVVTREDAIETLLGKEILDEFDEAADMQKVATENIKKYRLKYSDKIKSIH